jgi:superfamily I DNA and RNA helicase
MSPPSLSIIHGTNDKPAATEALISDLRDQDLDGQLLIGYPVIASPDGRYAIDALLVSPDHGLVCFDLVEGTELGDHAARQDEAYNRLYARLMPHQGLVRRRNLLVDITTVTYAPAILRTAADQEHPVVDRSSLVPHLKQLDWESSTSDLYDRTLSAIQSITAIRRPGGARAPGTPNSRSAKLNALENSIATLDRGQSAAVIETVDGVQRIRGLAGSGKTIVLALKAAYLHARHPDWQIAVTFHTRSLKDHFTRLITIFSIEQTGEEPDWDRLRVVNSWGAPGGADRAGIYYEFCRTHDLEYLNFYAAKGRFGFEEAFEGAVETALDNVGEIQESYDAVLVDEAQDFPPGFLRLCYEVLRQPKRLVYAYDELQNLTNEGLPSPEDIFGPGDGDSPRVSFDENRHDGAQRDIILERCYRNSRPVLVSAHGLGFGIYREPPTWSSTGLVQMFDRPELWTDVGYEVCSGELDLGKEVRLARPNYTSPEFLESHSTVEDLIRFKSFDDQATQAEWVASQIERNLTEDGLRHSDIIVISTDPPVARKKLGQIRAKLLARDIPSHLAGVDTEADVFRQVGSVTCTGIHRAKGNEAAMVYVVNAEEAHGATANLAHVRNRLFTAITRSTAWVRVCGVGSAMDSLIEEYEQVKKANFELSFRYPTQDELEKLTVVHRDMSGKKKKDWEKSLESVAGLIDDLKHRRILLEDIDGEQLATLRELLGAAGA